MVGLLPHGLVFTPAVETDIMPLNSDGWQLRLSLQSFSYIQGFFNTKYALAWVLQTDTTTELVNKTYWVNWFAPKWIAASASDYANYVCYNYYSTTDPTGANFNRPDIRQTQTSLISQQPKSKSSTLVAKGTKLTLNSERQGQHTGEFEQQTIGDQSWQTHRCQGWQESEATATFSSFTHGTTIKYTAGFVQY